MRIIAYIGYVCGGFSKGPVVGYILFLLCEWSLIVFLTRVVLPRLLASISHYRLFFDTDALSAECDLAQAVTHMERRRIALTIPRHVAGVVAEGGERLLCGDAARVLARPSSRVMAEGVITRVSARTLTLDCGERMVRIPIARTMLSLPRILAVTDDPTGQILTARMRYSRASAVIYITDKGRALICAIPTEDADKTDSACTNDV
jgi:hypothetical protein